MSATNAKSVNKHISSGNSIGSKSTQSTNASTAGGNKWVRSTLIHLGGTDRGDAYPPPEPETKPSIFPSHRIEEAVESELLAKQRVLDLQLDNNVKLNKEINLLTAEIEALRLLVEKKQTEMNRLNNIIHVKSDIISEQTATIKSLELDKGAFKLMEDQNKLLFEKLQVHVKDKDELSGILKKTLDEDYHLKTVGTTRLKSSVEAEVKLTAKLVSMEAQLSKITTEKQIMEARNEALQKQLAELNKQFLFIKDTSDDKLTRSRQTEYKTLQKINELQQALGEARDENEVIHESFLLACERGDMLQKRIQKAVDSSNNSFVLLNTVVDHIEEKYAEKVKEMKILKMKAAKLQMNYNVSRKAVDVMIKKDKIHNRNDNLSITMGRAANISKSSTEEGFRKTAPEDMLNNNTSNSNNTSGKLGVSFALEAAGSPERRDKVSDIIAIAPTEIENGRKKLLSRYLQYCVPIAPTIDLSNCQITDEDMPNVIEWLRVLTCKASKEIVFRNNKITEIGFRLLMIWMIALSREELLRSKPLLLDLRYNLISDDAIMSSLTQIQSLVRKEISLTSTESDGKIIVVYAPSGMISSSLEGDDKDGKPKTRSRKRDDPNSNTFGNQCVVRIDCRHNDVGGNNIATNMLKKKNLLSMGISDSIYDNKLLYSGTPLDTLTPSKLKMKPDSSSTGITKLIKKSASASNFFSSSTAKSNNNNNNNNSTNNSNDFNDDISISSNITDTSVHNNPAANNKSSTKSSTKNISMGKYVEYGGDEIEPSDITLPRDGIMSIRPEYIELFPIHQKY